MARTSYADVGEKVVGGAPESRTASAIREDSSIRETEETRLQSQEEVTEKTKESQLVRLNINLSPDTAEALQTLRTRKGVSATEAVRRAIAVWKFVQDELDAGNRIAVIEPSGQKREVVIIN